MREGLQASCLVTKQAPQVLASYIILYYLCSTQILHIELHLLVYVIGGSVVLFGKNWVLKLAVVNKIVRAQRVQFGNQRPISEPNFSQIAQLTHLSQVNSVHIVE